MGRKGNHNKKKYSKKTVEPEIDEQDLDRFAGSSGESDSEDDHDAPDPVESPPNKQQTSVVVRKDGPTEDGVMADREDHDDGEEEEEDSDFEQYQITPHQQQQHEHGSAGMANAMVKILGSAVNHHKKKTSATTTTAVLSKTITPLQRQQQKEHEQEKLLREKRRQKSTNPLPALHIPLSVATSLPLLHKTKGGSSVARELEAERLHRRVATRGVVALFNAVAQHQTKSTNTAKDRPQAKTNDEVKKMTKHGFLDMIKTAAASSSAGSKTEKAMPAAQHNKEAATKPRWNALQDDFMLNPKKNWDQEESSSDDSAAGDEDLDASGDEAQDNKMDAKADKGEKSRKKRRISKQ